MVHVTPQIAVEQAQAFFDDVSDEPVTACDPVKMVNSDGESIGYIVRAKRDDVNYGYVVFDSERSWWISEYYLARTLFYLSSVQAKKLHSSHPRITSLR